ncbi:UNVERIFIED_CONTAM: hypothetical protein GTU68_055254 [Idotea baltica]|nr:hypothetical protein [Idotea baltica]
MFCAPSSNRAAPTSRSSRSTISVRWKPTRICCATTAFTAGSRPRSRWTVTPSPSTAASRSRSPRSGTRRTCPGASSASKSRWNAPASSPPRTSVLHLGSRRQARPCFPPRSRARQGPFV